MSTQKDSNFAVALKGERIVSIVGAEVGSEEVAIKTKSGRTFRMYHEQDCCESVAVSRVYIGYGFNDESGMEVMDATEKIESDIPASESATRTTFVINPGGSTAVIEWIGESKGYYSESVSFVEVFP